MSKNNHAFWLALARVRLSYGIRAVSAMGLILSAGCGNSEAARQTDEAMALEAESAYSALTNAWPTLSPDYEYPSEFEEGATLCAMWEYDIEGQKKLVPEYYRFDDIKRKLEGLPSNSPLLQSLEKAGIWPVDSCDRARTYTRLVTEYNETAPRDDVYDVPHEPLPVEELPSRVDKIMDGTSWTNPPVVRLFIWVGNPSIPTECTGFLIGPSSLMTAAHCIPSDGDRSVSVQYNSGACLLGNCSGSTKPAVTAVGLRDPDAGSGPFHDVGLFLRKSGTWPSPANTSGSWERFGSEYIWSWQYVWLLGYGATSFSGNAIFSVPQRQSNSDQNPTVFDTNLRITTVAGEGRTCVGDSGGPAVDTYLLEGIDLAVGVASEFDSSNPWCPGVGNPFRHAHTNTSATWVKNVHAFLGSPCNEFEAPWPYGSFTYVRCW